MTLAEYYNRKIPDYYPTMYLDGYTSTEILYAANRAMIKRLRPEMDTYSINITSSVKVKK